MATHKKNPTVLYEPGTIVMVRKSGDEWAQHAVYLGPADRGLHWIAEASHHAAYYRAPQRDIDSGGREFPNLKWATWTARKVRASSILMTQAENDRDVEEKRANAFQRDQLRQLARAREDAAVLRIANLLAGLTEEVAAFPYRGHVEFSANADGLEKLADALTKKVLS